MLSDPYRCNFFMAKMHQKKGTTFVVPFNLKMFFHIHLPFLISDCKIWSHCPKILVSSVCSNQFFRPTFFCTMHYKSSTGCVCSNNITYPCCGVASDRSWILCFANLPRYPQPACNFLQALIHLLIWLLWKKQSIITILILILFIETSAVFI